jgi:hypothetical protein
MPLIVLRSTARFLPTMGCDVRCGLINSHCLSVNSANIICYPFIVLVVRRGYDSFEISSYAKFLNRKVGRNFRLDILCLIIRKFGSLGKRLCAMIKEFLAGRVLVTTVKRVHVKMMVTAFAFNLYQLCTLKNARII